MKRVTKPRQLHLKAASAALTILALSSLSAFGTKTIPSMPDEQAVYVRLKKEYHFREMQTPLSLKQFLNHYPASDYSDEVTLMLADWYFYNSEYPLALKYYESIRDDAFSGDLREGMLYRKAYSQIKTGFYREASLYLSGLTNSSRYGDDSRFYLAYIDYVNGKYDDAYDQFSIINRSGPKGSEAEFYLNQIDYRRGEFRKVANTSERLLAGAPVPEEVRDETLRVGALSFFKLADKASARNMLERYIGLTGDGAEISAIYSLATIYFDEGNFAMALPLFTTVTRYPGDLAQSAWLYIGQIYLNQGDAQKAALAFDKAAKESWNNEVAETAAYNLAVISSDGMGLPFSDAATIMENFIDTYPSSPYVSRLSSYLANAYYNKRDYENALRLSDKISVTEYDTKALRQKILYQLGVSQLQRGETHAAIKSLMEASGSDAPDKEVTAQAALWLGDAYYIQNNFTAAAKAYETAIASGKLAGNLALADYNLGYSYLKLRKYGKAESAFKGALNAGGLNSVQTADANLRYADCLYYVGKYQEALSLFRNIKLDGGSDAVFASIREADILGREGKINDKISILENLRNNPEAGIWSSTVVSRLADAYSEKGDDRKAAELYALILDSNSGNDNSQVFYSLAANAENLYNSGDNVSAHSAYRRLETSGIASLYPVAIRGIMRTASDNTEIIDYAAKAAALPGSSSEEIDEALLIGAEAGLASDAKHHEQALSSLNSLARSSDRLWGARAAVVLGEQLIKERNLTGAEEILLHLVDNGSDDNYWMARGYIALADVYSAQDKDYLAKLYLETLQSNYPGKEKDIKEMINLRLKALDK